MPEPPGPEEQSAGSEGPEDVTRRLIERTTAHALFMLDTDGVITTWHAPARELYGYEPATALGQHVRTLFADEEGGANDPSIATVLSAARTGTAEVEGWHERADGSVFWGTLTLSPLGNGEFEGYAAVCRDTTASKEYQRMLERQNDRLKEFTDILAHDLRNPLTVIDQRLALYEETGETEHLRIVDETTDRMARLVEDLLRVARQGNVVRNPEPTDIGGVVDTAWEGTAEPESALQYDAVRSVSADPDRLKQLFENLFRNSVEHGGGAVTVRVGPLADGFYVEDDGPGIPDDLGDDVFDHGVTTSEDGTGYGLSVVRTIVNAHGWDVTVTEASSGRARFEITGITFVD